MTRPGPVEVIVTGGQTGVDRAAMDFAIEVGIPLCGWIPQGRLDEHGVIPARYPGLVESDDADPGVRTRLNVRDSDGTLIIARGQLAGGTRLTAEEAARLNRPLIALDPDARDVLESGQVLRAWLIAMGVRRLNVAGPRASEDAGIYGMALAALRAAFAEPGA